MEYRDNWSNSQERLKAFWNREIIDRCCVAITAPKRNSTFRPEPFPEKREDKIRYWTDGEWVLKRNKSLFQNTIYRGEAFPQIFLNLGVAAHAGFFKNARYQFEDSTLWFFPSMLDWDGDQMVFDPDSFLYKKHLELARYFADESKGSFYVSMPDITGNADALAHLRGSENLLMDFKLEKERVIEALSKLEVIWEKIMGQIYDIVKENNDGGSTIGWLSTWAPGKHAQMQCDLSVMISEEDFSDFTIPELEAQSKWLDHALYHFDGIEQTRHLDKLLSLENLKAIQWTNVAGRPSPVEHIDIFKRIQNAGKGLLIFAAPQEVETLMENLSSKGLYLVVSARSEDEALTVEKMVTKLTHE